MKIKQHDFTLEVCNNLLEENKYNEHFTYILWSRILMWLGVSYRFIDRDDIEWRISYTPNNINTNMISMHVVDPSKRFNFYFQIPLLQKMQFNLFLGDSTYNFFEIYPLLINKNILSEGDYRVGGTARVLPHLMLADSDTMYKQDILTSINDSNFSEVCANLPQIEMLQTNFNKFIPPLQNIINGTWML